MYTHCTLQVVACVCSLCSTCCLRCWFMSVGILFSDLSSCSAASVHTGMTI